MTLSAVTLHRAGAAPPPATYNQLSLVHATAVASTCPGRTGRWVAPMLTLNSATLNDVTYAWPSATMATRRPSGETATWRILVKRFGVTVVALPAVLSESRSPPLGMRKTL